MFLSIFFSLYSSWNCVVWVASIFSFVFVFAFVFIFVLFSDCRHSVVAASIANRIGRAISKSMRDPGSTTFGPFSSWFNDFEFIPFSEELGIVLLESRMSLLHRLLSFPVGVLYFLVFKLNSNSHWKQCWRPYASHTSLNKGSRS